MVSSTHACWRIRTAIVILWVWFNRSNLSVWRYGHDFVFMSRLFGIYLRYKLIFRLIYLWYCNHSKLLYVNEVTPGKSVQGQGRQRPSTRFQTFLGSMQWAIQIIIEKKGIRSVVSISDSSPHMTRPQSLPRQSTIFCVLVS